MFDFKNRLRGGGPPPDAKDRLAVFASLDRRASHTTLRETQREALEQLSGRHEERDLVLKLSTGAGKTTISLVHLYAYMLDARKPAAYLCPRRQLVQQVLQEAAALGIPAKEYARKERYPDADCQRGEAILVCTYDKMFNARTTFRRDDVRLIPHALVLDDAHAGIEEIAGNYSLRFDAGSAVHDAVMGALAPARDYHSTKWIFIDRNDPDSILEVPVWIWVEVFAAVTAAIDEHKDDRLVKFVWPHLRERLRWCRCIVSGKGIEIAAALPFLDDFEPYAGAEHRLFTSATLADDSALVRALGCSTDAASSPVVPASDAGVGERMVIVPTLIDPALDRDWVMQWGKTMATAHRVVVLAPSEKRAREWEPVGAEVVLGDDVDDAVERLRSGTSKFVALVHRYDGVDLPDDSCRFLIIDGVPRALGLTEEIDSSGSLRSGVALRPTVHRIEQGMGRAVRSHVDYAVVVLAGAELASFVSHRDIEEHMGAATRAQIDLAHELAKIAREEVSAAPTSTRVHELALTCLKRDSGWKQYYDQEVRQVAQASSHTINAAAIDSAAAERKALAAALGGDTPKAETLLQPALANAASDQAKGRLLERLAWIQYEHDRELALRTQKSAHSLDSTTCLPPGATAPRRGATDAQPQAANVIRWYRQFGKPSAAQVEVLARKTNLSFEVTSKKFENALRTLGEILGAASTRPEDECGRGPDNLWDWAPVSWVIEAKNERGSLPKADGEQLLSAMQWFAENYPERSAVPVVACKVTECEWDASFPPDTRVIDEEGLGFVKSALTGFVGDLMAMDPSDEGQAGAVRDLLIKHGLGQDQLLNNCSKKLGKRKRR